MCTHLLWKKKNIPLCNIATRSLPLNSLINQIIGFYFFNWNKLILFALGIFMYTF